MATTATITPSQGSAPVTLQAGNYSAVDDRRFWGAGVREGVISGGSYQVIQRAAGANMTVDVACSVGSGAIVQGDSITAQGNYFVPPTTANVNVDIAAADATNPRNDLVVLEVKDDQHDAGGLNLARVRVITGTANASAAATDAPGANGTPALPSSCLLLAVVRVPNGVTSVTTSYINDRRPWAGGVPTYETSLPSPAVDGQEIYYRADSTNGIMWHLRYRNAFNGGSATYPWEYLGGPPLNKQSHATETTTSTTYTATGFTSITITPALKGEYLLAWGCNAFASTAGNCQMGLSVGGAAVDVTTGGISVYTPGANQAVTLQRTALTTLSSASTAVEVQHAVGAGTGSFRYRYLNATPVRVG